MTWLLFFLGASIFSSIFVLAAGMLSSRMNRQEDYVETFYTDAYADVEELPAQTNTQATE